MQIRWSPSHSYAGGPIIGVIRYGTRSLVQWSCSFIIICLCWFGVVTKRAHHLGPSIYICPGSIQTPPNGCFSVTLWVRSTGRGGSRGVFCCLLLVASADPDVIMQWRCRQVRASRVSPLLSDIYRVPGSGVKLGFINLVVWYGTSSI
jgi:hypothetical protein